MPQHRQTRLFMNVGIGNSNYNVTGVRTTSTSTQTPQKPFFGRSMLGRIDAATTKCGSCSGVR